MAAHPLFLHPPSFPPLRHCRRPRLCPPTLSRTPPTSPVIVIGGGAAGFFAAITLTRLHSTPCTILESSRTPLDKVRVSGGGRCNVTTSLHWHSPTVFASHYPRGSALLPSLLSRFGPADICRFFEQEHVPLKTEPSGKIFPVSNTSASVVDALVRAAARHHVVLRTAARVKSLDKTPHGFRVTLRDGEALHARYVLVATGSAPAPHRWLARLGHRIVPAVPSLFTFRVPDPLLCALAGVSVPDVAVRLRLPADAAAAAAEKPRPRRKRPHPAALAQRGPLLITHWGLSGPVVLSLSAFAARDLHRVRYRAACVIDWAPHLDRGQLAALMRAARTSLAQKNLANANPLPNGFPSRLWRYLVCRAAGRVDAAQKWGSLRNEQLDVLVDLLHACMFDVVGKGEFKDEFVTAGGVALEEVQPKTFESRLVDGLYFAGETLDVDGQTGGYNLEFAWSSGYVAGNAIAERLLKMEEVAENAKQVSVD